MEFINLVKLNSSIMKLSTRLDGINEYYFSQKLRSIDLMNKEGKNVINLGIGSPDLPPHPAVIETLHLESARPTTHAYQNYKGSPVFRKAIADWYFKWYQVELDPEWEVLPLMGSKEGIMHICMTYLDGGDIALIPNPGYPTYRSAVTLAGGTPVDYHLTAGNNWLPNLEELAQTDLSRVKLMFVNYPHMPTGCLPSATVFDELVAFAKTNHILLVHDNPYSFILNNNPVSIMKAAGAMDVALELNSLSKSHNMAGWRVGMLVGSKERVNEVLKFKSNMDSGMFLPVQLAAAKALQLDGEWHETVNDIYYKRQLLVFDLLTALGCIFDKNQAGMFVWASIPQNYSSGYELSDAVLQNANVFLTPGGIFGSNGDKYIRVSLCSTEKKIREAITRIKKSV
jgi:LL-diaminopimelate aminotransferase